MAELPDRSDSRAILIGTGTYQNTGFPALPAVANSLKGMAGILTELGGWPKERVTVLENPSDVRVLVPELRELITQTEGALFLYYAGHGIVLPNGQLCLALTDTTPGNADVDGLTYQKVRDLLLDSRARVIAVVLDCCYSGRAVTALSGPDDGSLDIKGVYTLAASTGRAHVVPLKEQARTATSFTQELMGLVRAGVPAGPALLTFGTLYKHLARRLNALSLPKPVQGNTDTAHGFLFARNVAHVPVVRAVERYAQAMADAFAPCRERGITEEYFAQSLYLSYQTLDGYLSGRWIAPEDVLLDFLDLLEEQGCRLDTAAAQQLSEIRAAAEAAIASDPDQGAALQEYNRELAAEARDLRTVLARERAEHAQAAGEADEKLSRLSWLTQQVEKQREQLVHAADLVRKVETENRALEAENQTLEARLVEIRSEADEIARDLRMLRAQLTSPVDAPPQPRAAEAALVGATADPTAAGAADPVRPPLAAGPRSGAAGAPGTANRPYEWRPLPRPALGGSDTDRPSTPPRVSRFPSLSALRKRKAAAAAQRASDKRRKAAAAAQRAESARRAAASGRGPTSRLGRGIAWIGSGHETWYLLASLPVATAGAVMVFPIGFAARKSALEIHQKLSDYIGTLIVALMVAITAIAIFSAVLNVTVHMALRPASWNFFNSRFRYEDEPWRRITYGTMTAGTLCGILVPVPSWGAMAFVVAVLAYAASIALGLLAWGVRRIVDLVF
ncbi:caspase family protein [Kitasatospora sp. NPDC057692]|uniref:caspase family protein n=1 Tax=Kitasatospora sp. NPDC057692 TaxID=3346215 RepID=UPI0036C9AAE5